MAALTAFVLTRDSGGLSSVSANSVGVIDPASNKLVAEVPVGIDPQAIATGLGGVWVTNVEDETVSRIDPTDTTARDATITVDGYPSDLAVGGGTVWVALGPLAQLQRINSEQNEAASPTSALGDDTPCGAPRREHRVRRGVRVVRRARAARSDRSTGRTTVATTIAEELVLSSSSVLPQFSDVAFGLGSLWIVNSARNRVVEVDPLTTQEQQQITVGKQSESDRGR